ncbi:MAG: ABC transporter substrate-binding protein [Promethearchaeota archaeon]
MSEKKPVPKKKKLIAEHKTIVVGGIVAAVALAGIVSGIVLFTVEVEKKRGNIVCAFNFVVDDLDPHSTRGGSWNVFFWSQVAEGLFEHDYSNPNNRIISNLAIKGEWSQDLLNFTCTLRKGVKFHDGTPFNATAVKWNFDRIHRLLDYMDWSYLWRISEDKTRINRTEVIDTYIVRFVLNKPYIPFKALLCSPISYMLSPTSTPADEFIDINSTLVGTGPFKFDVCTNTWQGSYIGICVNTTLTANLDYWGKKPYFDKIRITDGSYLDRIEGMKSKEISFVEPDRYEEIEAYRNMTDVTILEKPGLGVFWLHMNHKLFPVEMRKAISYAFNYTYYLEAASYYNDIDYGRAKSPITKGLLYSNWDDFDVPVYDIKVARQALIDANWPGTSGLTADDDISPGNEWETLANGPNPLATYNYSYVFDSWFQGNLSLEVAKNLKQIGVKIEPLGFNQLEIWIKMFTGDYDFILIGWAPSYNDPAEVINPNFSSKADGFFNYINFNDTLIQKWMDEALEEPDPSAREKLYYQIQERLIEELYSAIWLGSRVQYYIWASNIKGIQQEGPPLKILLKNGYFI